MSINEADDKLRQSVDKTSHKGLSDRTPQSLKASGSAGKGPYCEFRPQTANKAAQAGVLWLLCNFVALAQSGNVFSCSGVQPGLDSCPDSSMKSPKYKDPYPYVHENFMVRRYCSNLRVCWADSGSRLGATMNRLQPTLLRSTVIQFTPL